MKEPLVSVLVPVYNVEEYLERCLDSIINQTLCDIEIICVNDGSTDRSLKILEEYQKKDNRIRIIDKTNGGLPSARNAGLDAAKGKYVGFVDSDDYIEGNMYERLYEVAEKEKSELVICGAHIFPENPRASEWLYNCLSPWYQHYDEFQPSILFDCVCTTPFLWRTLIKRSLIQEYKLRLDEEILVGEDKAFQTKVYPKAKGITVIPDKLYHYCWYRENSMMNQGVYKISSQKTRAHSLLIENIAQELINSKASEEIKLAFVRWSIPFIYADFIYLPLETKIELANDLVTAWENCGYYNLKWRIEDWINEQFVYFCQVSKEKATEVKLSVVVPVCDRTEYIEQALKSILEQNVELECILVNNGASDATYGIMHKYLFKDKRIRLFNMEKKKYSDALNIGIMLATGDYVAFCETDGWYKNNTDLEKWITEAERTNSDVCASISAEVESDIFVEEDALVVDGSRTTNNRLYIDSDFHHMLYRRAFLIDKEDVRFGDNSIITGLPFLLRSVTEAEVKTYYPKQIYMRRHMHRQDWISTEKCVKVLDALDKLMIYSVEKANGDIQAKVLSLLNDDYMKRIIINNTRAYCMPPESRPNGENSQVEVFRHIYSIYSMVDSKKLVDADYDLNTLCYKLLYELIKERHKFLADISDRYHAY